MKRMKNWRTSLSAIMAAAIMLSYGGMSVSANETEPGTDTVATGEENPEADPEQEKPENAAPASDDAKVEKTEETSAAEDAQKAPSEKSSEEETPDKEPAKADDGNAVTVTETVDAEKPANAGVTASGNCGSNINGDNVTWELSEGVLTIKGSGRMSSSYGNGDAPWYTDYQASITSIVIESGVTYIGNYAFYALYNATSVSIPSTVTEIGERAFTSCGITSVNIPASVTSIYDNAFSGCENLKTVKFNNGNSSFDYIGNNVFYNSGITSITIPKTEYLGSNVCSSCTSLVNVTIENGVTSIPTSSFQQSALTSITIPGSVKLIDGYAFSKCTNLKTVKLEEGVKYIYGDAFSYCSALESVSIPSTITTIEDDAFYGCDRLANVYCYAAPTFNLNFEYDEDDEFMSSGETKFHVYSQYADDYASTYGSLLHAVVVGDLGNEENKPKIAGHSLTLRDMIAVNFFINLPDAYKNKNLTVEFSWGEGSYANSATGTLTKNGDSYEVSCAVAARAMNDKITMKLKDGSTVILTDEYSVVEYINVLATSNTDYADQNNKKLQDLLAALVQYGADAQKYFGYRTSALATSAATLNTEAVATVNSYKNSLKASELVRSDLAIKNIASQNLGIEYYGSAAVATSTPRVRLYFSPSAGSSVSSLQSSLRVSYKGQAISVHSQTVGGKELLYIEMAKINPGTLLNPITFTLNGKSYEYYLSDYVGNCMGQNDANTKNVAVSLYAYGNYAKVYLGG